MERVEEVNLGKKRKMKAEKVAIINCNSYKQEEVDKAVERALKLLNFNFEKHKKVLIKPNAVGNFPLCQIATTTHPSVIEAICKILKENKCKIFIGDSPFTNPEASFKASGIEKVAKKYGKLVIFEQEKLVKNRNENNKIIKKLIFPKIVKEVDLVINVPKLKTHSLVKYTGAIKNLYGFIPGGLKQRLHNKARGEEKFSELLIDIYQNIKPELNIMDGIIGMEGEGPSSGEAKKAGLILASRNAVALDIAAVKIIGYGPHQILMIRDAIKRKLYPNYKFELVGLNKLPKINFRKPTLHDISKTRKLMSKLFKERPIVVDEKLCTRDGLCEKHCPRKAIKLSPYPVINKERCIRCFCCIEICPNNALMIRK